MNVQGRITVTAAEFTRQFGHLRHALGDRPVHVTHHGRETHVLLAAARYDELRRLSLGGARAGELPGLTDLAGWIEHGVLVLDPAATVVFANAPAHAMLNSEPATLERRCLWDAAPGLASSLAASLIEHTLAAGEPGCADLPSPVRPGQWLQVAVHPSARGVTVLLRDITDEVRRRRIADEPSAVAAAVAMHPRVGRARLNPRGRIEDADEALCDLVGLANDRLRAVALIDLIPTAGKAVFREMLERVLGAPDEASVVTAIAPGELLTNGGRVLAVDFALSGLRGAYGAAGAVAVITRT